MTSDRDMLPAGPKVESSKRYYVSEDSHTYKYILPSDDEERERLNVQSQTLNKIFDNKLIWAPISFQDGDVVLDSGTGSGHWLLSLAEERDSNRIPTVHLRGIDISPRMFPPQSLTPSNTTFAIESITSLPDSWTSTISLVHQRLLFFGLQAPQWILALAEMYRVLVPGGWIQLCEPDRAYDTPSEAIRKHKASEIRKKLVSGVRHCLTDIADYLPGWIEQAGFVDLKIERRGYPMGTTWVDESFIPGVKAIRKMWSAMKEPVMKEGGLGVVSTGEEYDAVVRDLYRLCDETPGTYFPFLIFTAQKPVV